MITTICSPVLGTQTTFCHDLSCDDLNGSTTFCHDLSCDDLNGSTTSCNYESNHTLGKQMFSERLKREIKKL